jgi:hypothetical protein
VHTPADVEITGLQRKMSGLVSLRLERQTDTRLPVHECRSQHGRRNCSTGAYRAPDQRCKVYSAASGEILRNLQLLIRGQMAVP